MSRPRGAGQKPTYLAVKRSPSVSGEASLTLAGFDRATGIARQEVLQGFVRASESQLVPGNAAGVEGLHLEAFIVRHQRSSEIRRSVDDHDRCSSDVRVDIDQAVEVYVNARFLLRLANRRQGDLFSPVNVAS